MCDRKSAGWTIAVLVVLIAVVGIHVAMKKHDASLVASGHPEWPPIMYQNGDTIIGAGPALVEKIFDEIGVETSFPYEGTWDEVQLKAKSGEVDVLVAAYKTAEREGYMAYSDAYTTDPVALFVKKGKEFTFAKNEDLIGKHGVGTVGDSYGQTFDDFIIKAKLTVDRADTAAKAFDMVRQGKADYFVYSLYAGEKELKAEGGSGFAILPHYVAEENFYITISKKSPFLKYLLDVNRLLAKYKADGTIDALIEQYKDAM